jgi:hypothetical protein
MVIGEACYRVVLHVVFDRFGNRLDGASDILVYPAGRNNCENMSCNAQIRIRNLETNS